MKGHRTLLMAGVSALALVLSGCGALSVRTESASGGPLKVGVAETAGPAAPTTPAEDAIPDGFKRFRVEYSDKCPVQMSVALPSRWEDISPTTSDFRMYWDPEASGLDRSQITFTCTASTTSTAQDVVDSAARYRYSSSTSHVTSERKYAFGASAAWVFSVNFKKGDVNALSNPITGAGGILGVVVQGKTYQVSYLAKSPTSNTTGVETIKKIVANVRVGDTKLSPAN